MSQSSSPATDETLPNQLQLKEVPRSKRTRIASASGREQLQKRRKVVSKGDTDEISIPLRGRGVALGGLSPAVLTRSIPKADPIVTQHVNVDTTNHSSPLNSPTPKPQYDQIKRIEEKARALIHSGGAESSHKDERRRLRSEHGGTRSKTELAQYFPAFEEMLSLEPQNPGKSYRCERCFRPLTFHRCFNREDAYHLGG